jgi:hypothetical protein
MRLKTAGKQATFGLRTVVVVENNTLPGKKAVDKLLRRFRRVREWLAA